MQNIIKIVLGLFLTFTFLNAELLEQNGEKDGFNVKLTSTKALVALWNKQKTPVKDWWQDRVAISQ